MLWALLRGSDESFKSLGLGTRELVHALRSGRVWRGIVALLILSLVVVPTIRATLALHAYGGSTVLAAWAREPELSTVVEGWVREPCGLPWLLVFSVLGGGFLEELERAFYLTRFERGFGTAGSIGATIVGTFHFATLHLYQGHWQALSAGGLGLVMAVWFLRRRRAAETIVAHAGFDVAMVLIVYAAATSR